MFLVLLCWVLLLVVLENVLVESVLVVVGGVKRVVEGVIMVVVRGSF